MKSLTKLVMVMMMALALISSATVAFAQEESDGARPRNGLRGEVTAVSTSSLTVEPPNGESVTVNITDETTIRLVETQSEGTIDDIEVGNFVGVRGQKNDDGSVNARLIVVATRAQIRQHTLRGEVLAVHLDEGTLTVQSKAQDKAWLVKTTDETRYRVPDVENPTLADIKEGDHILIIGKRDDENSNSGTARAIVIIPAGQRDGIRLRGEITAVDHDEHTFVLHSDRGDVTVLTDDSTQYRTRSDQNISYDDIEVGLKAIVIGTRVEDQNHTIEARTVGLQLASQDGG